MNNLKALLAPIDKSAPTGPDLRNLSADTVFYDIDRWRGGAGFGAGADAGTADWASIISSCSAALSQRTKDLELAAALVQGLAATRGWRGLQDGLALVRQLVEKYWPLLHPGRVAGEIDVDIRVRPLSWLVSSRQFLDTIRSIPLVHPGAEQPRTLFDHETSQYVEQAATQNGKLYAELIAAGRLTGAQWCEAVAKTPGGRLDATRGEIVCCLTELAALETILQSKLGDRAPAVNGLRSLLMKCQSLVGQDEGLELHAANTATAAGPEVPYMPDVDRLTSAGIPGGGAEPGCMIASRRQAYELLGQVAEYLKAAEPHSPVSLLLERAVRWGRMSFGELLDDVVKSDDARVQVREVLGLQPPQEG